MSKPTTAPSAQPPYRRWFLILLGFTVGVLSQPYWSSHDSYYQMPDVGTYLETDKGMQPTTQKIHFDGVAYARLETGLHLWLGLAVLAIDVTFWAGARFLKSRRAMSPNSSATG